MSIYQKSQLKIETIRHSLAHIMAAAVQELYSGVHPVKSRKAGAAKPQFNRVKFGIGPAIENGFYYDFDFREVKVVKSKCQNPNVKFHPTPFDACQKVWGKNPKSKIQNEEFKLSPNDLPKIEEKMRELLKKGLKFEKKLIPADEAKKLFKKQPYKLDLIKELLGVGPLKVSVYQSGDFVDLCKGPHVKSTKEIDLRAFRLTKIAGAYWRGDEKNPMLTRIYGAAFETKKELAEYLRLQEEAEKRDHRVLGQKLELFMQDEEVGAGLPLWLPKGAILRKTIEDFLYKELLSAGYEWVATPHIGKLKLWESSGHWQLFRENMYSPIDVEEEKYLLKPMNCPFHVKIYKSKIRSYKDLPIKYGEFGTVYRYEKSGTLHGLTRVRGFTQDDAHIWCAPEQLNEELTKLLKHGLNILKTFGFKDFDIYLSTRPEKYAGAEKDWQKAINTLKYVLKNLNLNYKIDPGGGVFYGPKIDIKIKDNLGREWQCTTIQVDFNLPERFNITFVNKKGEKEQPFMLHRALLGSLERFIGVLIEHYAGAFPFWLAPVQVWVIPVGSAHRKYAKEVGERFKIYDLRFKLKDETETVSKKIREGELQKIPYLLVVGDKEMKKKTVRVRERSKGDIGEMKFSQFLERTRMEDVKKKP